MDEQLKESFCSQNWIGLSLSVEGLLKILLITLIAIAIKAYRVVSGLAQPSNDACQPETTQDTCQPDTMQETCPTHIPSNIPEDLSYAEGSVKLKRTEKFQAYLMEEIWNFVILLLILMLCPIITGGPIKIKGVHWR